jgi:2-haloacid dehalogenase
VPIAAVCFDLYGTLLSIERLEAPVAAAGIASAADFVRDWRRKQLENSFLTSIAGAYQDFDELTAFALDFTCAQRHVDLTMLRREELLEAVKRMPSYDDVAPVLKRLREHGVKLAVLTNGTPWTAEAALNRAGVRETLDDVLSVDSIRVYKPDPRVYALATARFECAPRDIVFVSSNGWDAWGAMRFGFRVAWCNRLHNARETLRPVPEITLGGLHELEAFVTAAR